MKKLMMTVVAMSMAFGVSAATANIDGVTWTYTVSNGKASVGGGSRSFTAVNQSTTGLISIPEELGGYPVTSIASEAFWCCQGLTGVIIPKSVTSIGDYAFSGCFEVVNVTIGEGVTRIGYCPFSSCHKLMSFNVDSANTAYCAIDGLLCTKDGKCLIAGVNRHVAIPASVTRIEDCAFRGICGLTGTMMIPKGVDSIGEFAFFGCNGLTSFSVDSANVAYSSLNGLLCTKDGKDVIAGVNGIVAIPASVTRIGDGAFYTCGGLKVVLMPASVSSIGADAFSGCSNLQFIEFLGAPPSGITESKLLDNASVVSYPNNYQSEWRKLVSDGRRLRGNKCVVDVVSTAIRENDPTIMDVVYKIWCKSSTVKVRVLAFEDGERSFAKVVRPETFVDGTGVNVGDNIEPNVEHKISWRVSSDWTTKLAKVKFEVLASEGELLPLETMTIPASDQYGKMKITWNAITDSQAFDALMWLYADKDSELTLLSGQLKSGNIVLAKGAQLDGGYSYYDENGNYVGYHYSGNEKAVKYIFSKMGYSLLTGAPLTYANQETRLGLNPSGARQYGYKIVE